MPTATDRPAARPDWTPTSWQAKPAAQQPVYPDPEALQRALGQLARLPPLVTSWEIENLKHQLAEATRGERFLLQGGDCSESFDDCESSAIASKLKILLQMSLVLVQGGKKRVTRIGRFAGQYAKPRSTDTETQNGVTLPSYRGDMINRAAFTREDRTPNPELLLRAFERSGLTINFIRSLIEGGFADLHHPEYWELGFVAKSPHAADYTRMVETIGDSLRFMETLTGSVLADINRVDFYTSHEGLHLYYEQAQTRQVPRRPGWYNLATHFPWIGDRTRTLDGAHVEYFRGIANPIGVKIGPAVTPDEVLALAGVLNPQNEPGRLTLIHRFGADRRGEVPAPAGRGNSPPGPAGALVLRPYAWQHRDDQKRHQDPPVRENPRRTGVVLAHPQGLRRPPGWCAFRTDRRQRDGMHRRRERGDGG